MPLSLAEPSTLHSCSPQLPARADLFLGDTVMGELQSHSCPALQGAAVAVCTFLLPACSQTTGVTGGGGPKQGRRNLCTTATVPSCAGNLAQLYIAVCSWNGLILSPKMRLGFLHVEFGEKTLSWN